MHPTKCGPRSRNGSASPVSQRDNRRRTCPDDRFQPVTFPGEPLQRCVEHRPSIADAIGVAALDYVSTVPLGQFFVKTAFRRQVTGVLQGVAPYPWNVRPA